MRRKSKVIRCRASGWHEPLKVKLNFGKLVEVREFKYVRLNVSDRGRMKVKVSHRVNELRLGWINRSLSIDVKVNILEGTVTPSVLYGF